MDTSQIKLTPGKPITASMANGGYANAQQPHRLHCECRLRPITRRHCPAVVKNWLKPNWDKPPTTPRYMTYHRFGHNDRIVRTFVFSVDTLTFNELPREGVLPATMYRARQTPIPILQARLRDDINLAFDIPEHGLGNRQSVDDLWRMADTGADMFQ